LFEHVSHVLFAPQSMEVGVTYGLTGIRNRNGSGEGHAGVQQEKADGGERELHLA
jgi:hypothetical protein